MNIKDTNKNIGMNIKDTINILILAWDTLKAWFPCIFHSALEIDSTRWFTTTQLLHIYWLILRYTIIVIQNTIICLMILLLNYVILVFLNIKQNFRSSFSDVTPVLKHFFIISRDLFLKMLFLKAQKIGKIGK